MRFKWRLTLAPTGNRMTATEPRRLCARQMAAAEASPATSVADMTEVRHSAAFLKSIRARDAIAYVTQGNLRCGVMDPPKIVRHPAAPTRRLVALPRLAGFLASRGKSPNDPTRTIRRARHPFELRPDASTASRPGLHLLERSEPAGGGAALVPAQ